MTLRNGVLLAVALSACTAFALPCVEGQTEAWTTIQIPFTLDEECCDWEITSCPSGTVNTTFSAVEGPNILFEGDSNTGLCINPCMAWAEPDVVNPEHGDSFVPPGNNPPQCLPPGDYMISLLVSEGWDPASCEPLTGLIGYTVCFDFCDGGTAGAVERPADFGLLSGAPNPFNPSTTLRFELDEPGDARLAVHDLSGALVATLIDGALSRGEHEAVFDAGALPSGVYVALLESGGRSSALKLLLAK